MSGNDKANDGAEGVGLLRYLTLGAWLGTQRDRRNQVAILRWSVLLAAGVVASAFVLRPGPQASEALKWLTLACLIALLIPWLFSYLRFLREADELIRTIQLEALAVGFCAGFAFGVIYTVLGRVGIPGLDPAGGVPLMVAVMALGYALGRVIASKRYR